MCKLGFKYKHRSRNPVLIWRKLFCFMETCIFNCNKKYRDENGMIHQKFGKMSLYEPQDNHTIGISSGFAECHRLNFEPKKSGDYPEEMHGDVLKKLVRRNTTNIIEGNYVIVMDTVKSSNTNLTKTEN